MRTVITLFIFLFSLFAFDSSGQCDQEALLKKALTEMDDGQYIRDLVVDFNADQDPESTHLLEYAVILNSRCQYKFKLVYASEDAGKVVMELFDGDKIVASNVGGAKVYDAFGFICQSTKVYQLVFSYTGQYTDCARMVLSLQKQFSEGEMGF
jgi:hypothetical protein